MIKIAFNGKMHTYKELVELTGLKKQSLVYRVEQGIPLDAPKSPGNNKTLFNSKNERECWDCSIWTKTKHPRCSKCRYQNAKYKAYLRDERKKI